MYKLIRDKSLNTQSVVDVIQNQEMEDQVVELGPRIDLRLMRVLAGLMRGELLYHRFKDYRSRMGDVRLEKRAKETLKR